MALSVKRLPFSPKIRREFFALPDTFSGCVGIFMETPLSMTKKRRSDIRIPYGRLLKVQLLGLR